MRPNLELREDHIQKKAMAALHTETSTDSKHAKNSSWPDIIICNVIPLYTCNTPRDLALGHVKLCLNPDTRGVTHAVS